MEQQKRGSFQKVRRQDGDYSQSNTTGVMGKENGKGRFNDCVSLCRKLLCLAIVHQLSVTSLMALSTLPRALKQSVMMGLFA